MTPQAVLALITTLDTFFELGGKLLEEAMKREPSLNVAPIPDLSEVDKARADALSRTGQLEP